MAAGVAAAADTRGVARLWDAVLGWGPRGPFTAYQLACLRAEGSGTVRLGRLGEPTPVELALILSLVVSIRGWPRGQRGRLGARIPMPLGSWSRWTGSRPTRPEVRRPADHGGRSGGGCGGGCWIRW